MAGVIIEILEPDFVSVFWRFDLLDVEIDHVVISEVDEQLGEALVLQNSRQELVRFDELAHELGSELVSGNADHVFNVYVGHTPHQEHLSGRDEPNSLLEGHLDVIRGLYLDFLVERDMVSILDPVIILLAQLLVVQAALVLQEIKDLLRIGTLQPEVEESGLLSCEPLAEVFISAVSKPADEV